MEISHVENEVLEGKEDLSLQKFTIQEVEVEPVMPHEALFLVLAYLPVYELLAMSQVCISLRDAVNNDVLPWLNIIVKSPLNSQLCDENLMKITSKAEGRLKALVLMNCTNITDDGFQRVINGNPYISKLYVPDCTGITPEGVTRAVKTLCQASHCLRNLRIRGIYNLNKDHLETLCFFLQKNLAIADQQRQPVFYHIHGNSTEFRQEESQQMIDLEICPNCKEARNVYDCPRGSCKRKEDRPLTECRACIFCIPRCEECGECVEPEELEYAVCGEILCTKCWLQLPKCNFCNKPYCNRHANQWCRSSASGLVCEVCHAKFTLNFYNDVI
ncbi:F-box protein [Quillaja saponaria]|uniref:F-box protein n=1 Tax=Quillaja saponaria TaxID=32244 RepID=A0AAD7KQ90_QUISA|nr:F-box protein [Quillaja saponaria]